MGTHARVVTDRTEIYYRDLIGDGSVPEDAQTVARGWHPHAVVVV